MQRSSNLDELAEPSEAFLISLSSLAYYARHEYLRRRVSALTRSCNTEDHLANFLLQDGVSLLCLRSKDEKRLVQNRGIRE